MNAQKPAAQNTRKPDTEIGIRRLRINRRGSRNASICKHGGIWESNNFPIPDALLNLIQGIAQISLWASEHVFVDDDDVRTMLGLTLEGEGYEVREANNGNETLKLYQEHPADLIITDIMMPDKDGLELIMEFHRHDPLQISLSSLSPCVEHHQRNIIMNLDLYTHEKPLPIQ